MRIEIDKSSGFCFGVVKAIEAAETELLKGEPLYCLGDIVHNEKEVQRLAAKGLITINHHELEALPANTHVLLRAHGEPPSTYLTANHRHLVIKDASCPVVLQLQNRIKSAYLDHPESQIIIYGKKGHAEVNGLVGQTENHAIVIENRSDLDKLDYSQPIILFSQTTKLVDEFSFLAQSIKDRMLNGQTFKMYDTICRQVANRIPNIRSFSKQFDLIYFVSGTKSSNGKILFEECHKVNPNAYLIQSAEQVEASHLKDIESIGICGATSTPRWLMQSVEARILEYSKQDTN